MKRIIKIMAVTTIVGISMATYAFAGYGNQFFKNSANYVDADGNGVCDNYGVNGNGVNYVDTDGNGVCDNYGVNGNGVNYIDTDGDGVCDNYGNKVCPRNGMGRKLGLNK